MSHELRTPLNGLVAGAALLTEAGADVPAVAGALGETAARMSRLVDDVLELSAMDAGGAVLAAEPLVPAAVAREAARRHARAAAAKGLGFALDLAPTAEAPRLGDARRLADLIDRTLDNAVGFTEAGGVALALSTTPEALILAIADTGLGMDAWACEKLFAPFEQAEAGPARRRQGAGLGMTLVRRIVDVMDGAVGVESVPGRGTTLRFTLPMPLAPAGSLAPVPSEPAPTPSLAGRTALIADDVDTNRLVLAAHLERLGLRVLVEDGGAAAVERRFRETPDLVVLDLSMPGMDGVSALAAMREGERRRGAAPVPALAVTAHPVARAGARLGAEGFADVLGKPLDPLALAAAVTRCLAPASGEGRV
jgi:CheY-like chemotaxis protein